MERLLLPVFLIITGLSQLIGLPRWALIISDVCGILAGILMVI